MPVIETDRLIVRPFEVDELEAVRALIDHMFIVERLWRMITQTSAENIASQGVMRRLGMRIERIENPIPDWMRVVGVLENEG
jgi:hypothetical protein